MKQQPHILSFSKQQMRIFASVLCCLILAFSLFATSGCKKKEAASYEAGNVMGKSRAEAPASVELESADKAQGGFASPEETAVSEPSDSSTPQPVTPNQPTQLFQPQIIKTATLSIKVENLEKDMKALQHLIKRYNGLITNQSLSLAEAGAGYRSGSVEVRIPEAQLDSFLSETGSVGKILSQQVTGQDVGAEIVDTRSRIKNLKAEEEALQAIMKRSGKIPEVLEVSKELARVRGEIEQAQGRLNYLTQQVAYSTVRIDLSEENLITPSDSKTDIGTMMENTFKKAMNALDDLIRGLINTGIWFVVLFLPIILVIFGLLYLVYKVIRGIFGKCCKKWQEQKKFDAEKKTESETVTDSDIDSV